MHVELTQLIAAVIVSLLGGTGGGALLMRRRMIKNGGNPGHGGLTSGERKAVYKTEKSVSAVERMLCQQRPDGKYELYAKLDEVEAAIKISCRGSK